MACGRGDAAAGCGGAGAGRGVAAAAAAAAPPKSLPATKRGRASGGAR